MKNYFEKLLKVMQEYVDKNTSVREQISKISNNGDLSDSRKETDANALKSQLVNYGNECIKTADSIIDGIMEIVRSTNVSCDVAKMQGLFVYISTSGSKCNVNVLLSQIKPYAGNLTAIQAILDVAENSGVNEACKRCTKDFLYTPEEIENELKENAQLVFVGAKSATEFGKTVERVAEKLGIEIVSSVKDEFTDNQLLRRAFGLE